ncbi:MAG: hypothetical protein ACI9UO_002764 [Nitrospinales bacterium]|jgi:hypothetical protein
MTKEQKFALIGTLRTLFTRAASFPYTYTNLPNRIQARAYYLRKYVLGR